MAIMPLFKRCFEDTQSTFLGAKMPSKHQFICLNVIYMFQPITMGDLARQIGVSRQQLTRVVNELAKTGLVERYPNPDCRKVFLARISDKGEKLISSLRDGAKQKFSFLLSALTEEDIDRGIDYIRGLSDLFNKLRLSQENAVSRLPKFSAFLNSLNDKS